MPSATPRPWLTHALIGACILVALLTSLGADRAALVWLTLADPRTVDGTVASGLEALGRGELWRLLTPILIHFGPLHLLFNLWWLLALGSLIERRWSWRSLAVLVAVSGAASNLAQYLVNWDWSRGLTLGNVFSGGMSGVIYALLGSLWVRSRQEPDLRPGGETLALMLGWLVLGFTGLLGPIGNTAHLVGLVAGAAWAWVASRPRERLGR